MLICPICKEELNKIDRTFKCINNHSFDMAKQGYVNLYISNKKNSGDDKEMIQSRRDFLEKGYYEEVSKVVNKEVLKLIKEKSTILDIGCGEGYYTERLRKDIVKENKETEMLGIDISKEGVLLASRSYKNIFWSVGSAITLPIKEKVLDVVLCMFSRLAEEEYNRVLKDDGYLVVASTGENHLLELKETMYEKVRLEYFRPETDLNEKFSLLETKNVNCKIKIDNQKDIMNLFDMTPYKWKTPKEGVAKLEKLNELEVTIDVNIDIFEKK